MAKGKSGFSLLPAILGIGLAALVFFGGARIGLW